MKTQKGGRGRQSVPKEAVQAPDTPRAGHVTPDSGLSASAWQGLP